MSADDSGSPPAPLRFNVTMQMYTDADHAIQPNVDASLQRIQLPHRSRASSGNTVPPNANDTQMDANVNDAITIIADDLGSPPVPLLPQTCDAPAERFDAPHADDLGSPYANDTQMGANATSHDAMPGATASIPHLRRASSDEERAAKRQRACHARPPETT